LQAGCRVPEFSKINNERRIRMDAQSEKITGRNCDAFLGERFGER